MNAPGRVFVIFNPAAGRGRGARRIRPWLDLLEAALPDVEHAVTTRAGEEAELAERAVAAGFDTVVGAGGDGTWSHVADRLVAANLDGARVRMGILPSGTGNDFGRNLGLRYGDMRSSVQALAAGRARPVDVGRVVSACRPIRAGGSQADGARADGRRADGNGADVVSDVHGPGQSEGVADPPERTRYFLNVVGFGFDVAVIDAAAGARFLRGELLYKATAVQQLFSFPGVRAAVRDGAADPEAEADYLMLTISNGQFFGGGFPIAPGAGVEDGRLHACLIGDAAPLTRARLFGLAQKGRHVESDRVRVLSGRRFAVTFPQPPRFEVDGDLFASATSTVEVEVLPAALDVIAG